jgi:hypothetical protein
MYCAQVVGFFRVRQEGVDELRRDFVYDMFDDEVYCHTLFLF